MNFNTRTRKLLVQYSNPSRATLLPSTFAPSSSMPRARQQRRRRAKTVKRAKVRVVKGHLTLKVAGYPGLHRFGASQLIQFVPLNKIKVAAKKFWSSPTKGIALGQDNGSSLRFALADIGKAAKVRVDDRLWATPHQEEQSFAAPTSNVVIVDESCAFGCCKCRLGRLQN